MLSILKSVAFTRHSSMYKNDDNDDERPGRKKSVVLYRMNSQIIFNDILIMTNI